MSVPSNALVNAKNACMKLKELCLQNNSESNIVNSISCCGKGTYDMHWACCGIISEVWPYMCTAQHHAEL